MRTKKVTTPAIIQDEVAIRTFAEGLLDVTRLLPHPSKVLQSIVKQIDVYEATIKQPDIAAVARRFRDGIKKLEWDISRVTLRGERAAFVRSICRDLPLNTIIPAAVSARDFGYTVLETTWKKIGSYNLITNLEEKPREWFRFNQANQLLLITRDNPNGIVVEENWPRKFILVQHEASYKNPYGNGLLDEAYWYSKGLAANFEYHLGFLEDDGRDHWMGWVPPGSDNTYKEKVELALRRLRNAAVAVIEEGTRIEKVVNTGRQSTSDAYEIFKTSCRSTINMLWLGSDLATNAKGTGSYASSKSGIEIQADALEAGKELAEQAINQTIKWMAEVNNLPGDDTEEVAFYLYKAPANDKEQAAIDEIYSRTTGLKPSRQLLIKRGYEDGDFEAPAASVQARAVPQQTFESGYNLEPLLSAAEALKKKH
jgi:phage gp29-like protein